MIWEEDMITRTMADARTTAANKVAPAACLRSSSSRTQSSSRCSGGWSGWRGSLPIRLKGVDGRGPLAVEVCALGEGLLSGNALVEAVVWVIIALCFGIIFFRFLAVVIFHPCGVALGLQGSFIETLWRM